MPDLSAKILDITDRQDLTNLKLDALITASGGAPPAPGATLADVVAALALTNAKLDSVISALGLVTPEVNGLQTRMTSLVNAQINTSNQAVLIRTAFDTFIDDYFSGDGTKQLLENIYGSNLSVRRALYETFCGCDTTYTPIPPLLTGGVPANLQEHCRRTQFQLDRFENMLDDLVVQLAAGGGISAALVASLFAAGVLTAGASVPPALIISALAILGGLAAGAADNVRDGFVANKEALRQAVYNAPDAASAKAAFDSVITAASPVWGGNFADIIKILAWASWFNDIYDLNVSMDTTGYDGTICAPFVDPCILSPLAVNYSAGNQSTTFYGFVWPSTLGYSTRSTDLDGIAYNPINFLIADFTNWTVRVDRAGAITVQGMSFETANQVRTITSMLNVPYLFAYAQFPFRIRLCPPGESNATFT